MNHLSHKHSSMYSAASSTLVVALMIVFTALPSNLFAQDTAKQDTVQSDSTRVESFALQRISAKTAAETLKALLTDEPGMRVAADETENRLIVLGNAEQLDSVRELLEQLDRPRNDVSSIKVFALEHSDAAAAAKVIGQILNDVTLAIDTRSNSLVVSASSEESLDKIELLTQLLDREQQPSRANSSYKIDLFWLIEASDGVPDVEAKTGKPDARIAEAVTELQAQGFKSVVQVGHVHVVVRSSGEFRVSSNESAGYVSWNGKLYEGSDQQLELTLDLDIEHENGGETELMTEINTHVGHNVVIGITSVTAPRNRNAFVIRVEK